MALPGSDSLSAGRTYSPNIHRRVDPSERPLQRLLGQRLGLSNKCGRKWSSFGVLVYVLDGHFPELEIGGNPHHNPETFNGRFTELVYEIVQQIKPALSQAPKPERIDLPSGVDVARQDLQGEERQRELNAIGRYIKRIRSIQEKGRLR